MLIVTIWALIWQITNFFPQKQYLLGTIGIILLCLAVFMVIESIRVIKERKSIGG
jgi:hypothetical protein